MAQRRRVSRVGLASESRASFQLSHAYAIGACYRRIVCFSPQRCRAERGKLLHRPPYISFGRYRMKSRVYIRSAKYEVIVNRIVSQELRTLIIRALQAYLFLYLRHYRQLKAPYTGQYVLPDELNKILMFKIADFARFIGITYITYLLKKG